jgi:hypothetical protein
VGRSKTPCYIKASYAHHPARKNVRRKACRAVLSQEAAPSPALASHQPRPHGCRRRPAARQPPAKWLPPAASNAPICGAPKSVNAGLIAFILVKTSQKWYFLNVTQGDKIMKTSFADVLDAAGSLRVDEREELVELLQKRTIEERRVKLVKDIKNARSDYKNRKYSVASANGIMKELLS